MEFNIASVITLLFGTVLGSLITALWINAKMNARLAVVEDRTKSIPKIFEEIREISDSIQEMRGYNRGAMPYAYGQPQPRSAA